ncbi:site-specific tyrosine recombinase XerC [Luteolibacter algae]|uniref:Site-specific tyrosine recombinase XerC n=1 Tax=Luteolibacter algae TaxID=454151 RepID=A0ABW5D9D0_9BACT
MPRKKGKKGYKATHRLRQRDKDKRGGNAAQNLPSGEAGSLAQLAESYLENLAVRNYTADTIEGRRDALKVFLLWVVERELLELSEITKPILESYQRHLWRWRKTNGKPLGISTQRSRLGTVKDFFAHLVKQNHLPANPASELEMPRPEKCLPQESLSLQEVKQLLNVPDTTDPLGLRDRSILETFYSTGMRRGELAKLELHDLNRDRQTIRLRQGKGHKDRVVPVGTRALKWLERYLDETRPKLLIDPNEKALFVTSYGEAFNPDVLSRMVSKFIKRAEITKPGSCHILRHSCATHMLEGGADIRFIQQLLGHEKLETTAIYTHVSIEQLKAVHSKTHPAEKPPEPRPDDQENDTGNA